MIILPYICKVIIKQTKTLGTMKTYTVIFESEKEGRTYRSFLAMSKKHAIELFRKVFPTEIIEEISSL